MRENLKSLLIQSYDLEQFKLRAFHRHAYTTQSYLLTYWTETRLVYDANESMDENFYIKDKIVEKTRTEKYQIYDVTKPENQWSSI